ncbi:MAG: hypothetical protein PsegKO_20320 [Pseudohongiellaceae bacterium]
MPTEQEIKEQEQQQQRSALEDAQETAGQLLRRTRVDRGLDEKQVADQLRITVHYVKAIETDHYEKLPGAIFARGYIKSYAKLLKLDQADIVARYEAATSSAQPSKRTTENAESGAGGYSGAQWAMASAAALVVLAVGVWVVSGPTVESTEVAASSNAGRAAADAAPQRAEPVLSNPITAVERPVANEPTLPVPESPATRSNPALPVVSAPYPASTEPDTARAVAETISAPQTASAEPQRTESDAAEPTGQAVAETESSSASEPSQAASEPASTPAVAQAAEPAESAAPEPESAAAADSGQPETLVEINVLQGDNGERIITVQADGTDVLRIDFSGESWVEVNDADQRMIYRDLRESGDILEITGRAPFNVLLGDAPLANVRLNGNAIDVSDDIRVDNSARLTVGI